MDASAAVGAEAVRQSTRTSQSRQSQKSDHRVTLYSLSVKTDRKALAQQSKEALDVLTEWAKLKPFSISRVFGPFFNGGIRSDFFRYYVAQGSGVGVSALIQMAQLDRSRDGEVSDKELAEFRRHGKDLVDGTLSLSLNSGVVSALIISVVYPLASEPISSQGDPWLSWCKDSWNEASSGGANEASECMDLREVSLGVHHVCVQLCMLLALLCLWVAARSYTVISYWMAELEDKVWYITSRRIVMQAQVMLPLVMIHLMMISLFASGIASSSKAVVTTCWFPLVGFVLWELHYEGQNAHCVVRMHSAAVKLVNQVAEDRKAGRTASKQVAGTDDTGEEGRTSNRNASSRTLTQELKDLAELHKEGMLSDAEFRAAKTSVLSNVNIVPLVV